MMASSVALLNAAGSGGGVIVGAPPGFPYVAAQATTELNG